MSELVADFVDNLPCSEKKVALDVVAVHCATREQWKAELDTSVVEIASGAGVGELGKSREDPIENSSCAEGWQIGTR